MDRYTLGFLAWTLVFATVCFLFVWSMGRWVGVW